MERRGLDKVRWWWLAGSKNISPTSLPYMPGIPSLILPVKFSKAFVSMHMYLLGGIIQFNPSEQTFTTVALNQVLVRHGGASKDE